MENMLKCPKTREWLPCDNEECPMCEYFACHDKGFVICDYYDKNPKHNDNRNIAKIAMKQIEGVKK